MSSFAIHIVGGALGVAITDMLQIQFVRIS